MSSALQIDYVEFPATDLNAVQAFYEVVFGWEFTDYGPDYRAFADGRLNGGFFASPAKSQTQTGGALVVLYAADLESVRNAVLHAGGQLSKDIFSFPGGRRFQFLDPHGNELAVWTDQTPASP